MASKVYYKKKSSKPNKTYFHFKKNYFNTSKTSYYDKIKLLSRNQRRKPKNDRKNNYKIESDLIRYQNNTLALYHKKKKLSKLTGIRNIAGSTCYLNSLIQCLIQTPYLSDFLQYHYHSLSCQIDNEVCLFCELESEYHSIRAHSGSIVSIYRLIKALKRLSPYFQLGQQEDPHEYLLFIFDILEKSCIHNHNNINNDHLPTKHTEMPSSCIYNSIAPSILLSSSSLNIIQQIFGATLKNHIYCHNCRHVSEKNDPCLEVSLDISHSHINSLQQALSHHTSFEHLFDKDNLYRCNCCKQLVTISKRLTFYKPPQILVVHFKRFAFTDFYHFKKITRFIHYPINFDLSPYCSNNKRNNPIYYNLYAILVHQGRSMSYGHYVAYVRYTSSTISTQSQWFCCDDTLVYPVSTEEVLQQNAYLLFYSQQSQSPLPFKLSLSLSLIFPPFSSSQSYPRRLSINMRGSDPMSFTPLLTPLLTKPYLSLPKKLPRRTRRHISVKIPSSYPPLLNHAHSLFPYPYFIHKKRFSISYPVLNNSKKIKQS